MPQQKWCIFCGDYLNPAALEARYFCAQIKEVFWDREFNDVVLDQVKTQKLNPTVNPIVAFLSLGKAGKMFIF